MFIDTEAYSSILLGFNIYEWTDVNINHQELITSDEFTVYAKLEIWMEILAAYVISWQVNILHQMPNHAGIMLLGKFTLTRIQQGNDEKVESKGMWILDLRNALLGNVWHHCYTLKWRSYLGCWRCHLRLYWRFSVWLTLLQSGVAVTPLEWQSRFSTCVHDSHAGITMMSLYLSIARIYTYMYYIYDMYISLG